MKKIIIALCLSILVIISLVSCGGNNNNKDKESTDTKKNDGIVTDTGTDSNIIDRAESMVDGVESDIMGTR